MIPFHYSIAANYAKGLSITCKDSPWYYYEFSYCRVSRLSEPLDNLIELEVIKI